MQTTGFRMVVAGMMALLAGSAAQAGHRVVVYVKQDNYTVASLGRAEETAKRVMAQAGIALTFRDGSARNAKSGETTIQLQLDGRVPDVFHPGAFGYAAPYGNSGTQIHILCDRVQRSTPDAGSGVILGYVLAHEIAHVLQGVGRHSAEGVLKAHWETADYRRMKSGGLPFDANDMELMQQAIAVRAGVRPKSE